ncbi:hypothetical protein IQ06DRAFT_307377 [Phaeosphaeriaceae sp. SRC1lsM3a]|nr:hypothetical protein IQ06DRAFT_307377 [Stagonospora sp. SRC1lsM3a]
MVGQENAAATTPAMRDSTQAFKGKSADVSRLSIEIKRLQTVLPVVGQALGAEGISVIDNPETTKHLERSLTETLHHLEESQSLFERISKERRPIFIVKLKNNLRSIIGQLRDCNTSLAFLLSVLAITHTTRAESELATLQISMQTQPKTIAEHRLVYLITRYLGTSGSSPPFLPQDTTEELAQTHLSLDAFEKMTKVAKASITYIGGTYDVHARNCQVFLQRLVLRIRAPIEITEVFDGMIRGVNLDLPMDEAPTVLERRCKEWKQWRQAHGTLAYRFGKQPRPESFPNDVLGFLDGYAHMLNSGRSSPLSMLESDGWNYRNGHP